MRLAHAIVTYAIIAMGAIHVAMAPVFFEQFTMRVMWYAAQGLMLVFVAFLNIACRRLQWREPRIAALAHLANLLSLIFAMLYVTVDTSPPGFAGMGLLVMLGASGLLLWRRRAS